MWHHSTGSQWFEQRSEGEKRGPLLATPSSFVKIPHASGSHGLGAWGRSTAVLSRTIDRYLVYRPTNSGIVSGYDSRFFEQKYREASPDAVARKRGAFAAAASFPRRLAKRSWELPDRTSCIAPFLQFKGHVINGRSTSALPLVAFQRRCFNSMYPALPCPSLPLLPRTPFSLCNPIPSLFSFPLAFSLSVLA